jgi:methanogenic corrinoid protein MtbC1
MVTMRHQSISDDSLTEAAAMRMLRSLGSTPHARMAGHMASRHAVLTRTVAEEVIPRLIEARRSDSRARPQPALADVTGAQVRTLAHLLLDGTRQQATAFVAAVQQTGIGRESVLVNLLAPAARYLGELWETDVCSFADVTIGMLRLNTVMRVVGQAFEAEASTLQAGPRALLIQAPGEQHGLGIAMLAGFFRRSGWNVQSAPVADRTELTALVKRDWFSLAGLSVACSNRLDSLGADISAIRAASRNPAIAIMVGGFAFGEHPQLAAMVGADGTAPDARQAVARANALVSHRACQR